MVMVLIMVVMQTPYWSNNDDAMHATLGKSSSSSLVSLVSKSWPEATGKASSH